MINCEDLKFEHPSNWLIGAPSQSGKTHLVYNILKNNEKIIKPKVSKFIYCYTEWQPLYEKMVVEIKNSNFIKGLPEFEILENSILILDDLMSEVVENKKALFTVGSHQKN